MLAPLALFLAVVFPETTFPFASITNGVASVVAESSTTKLFPEPTLVIVSGTAEPLVTVKLLAAVPEDTRLVAVAAPSAGVTKVGLLDSTTFVVPVDVVTPVPPFATGNVPVTPVVKGKPVALVKTRLVGVPRFGVTKVGEVLNTRLVDVVPVAPAAV